MKYMKSKNLQEIKDKLLPFESINQNNYSRKNNLLIEKNTKI